MRRAEGVSPLDLALLTVHRKRTVIGATETPTADTVGSPCLRGSRRKRWRSRRSPPAALQVPVIQMVDQHLRHVAAGVCFNPLNPVALADCV